MPWHDSNVEDRDRDNRGTKIKVENVHYDLSEDDLHVRIDMSERQ